MFVILISGHKLVPVRLCDAASPEPAQLLHHAGVQRGRVSLQLDHGTVGPQYMLTVLGPLTLHVVYFIHRGYYPVLK